MTVHLVPFLHFQWPAMLAPRSNNMPWNTFAAICLFVSFSHGAALSNLSAIEQLLLSSRLTKIQNAVATKFQSAVGPQLLERSAKDVTIIFPGAGGRDAISDELEESLRRSSASTHNAFVTTFDWQEHRGTVLTAAYDSETVGETVGKCLWEVMNGASLQLRSVHCVGISVGAFGANGMAREICSRRGSASRDGESSPYVRLTLLAPFTSRGVTGSSYGPDNFGTNADYAVQYMTKEDPVPTTDKKLPQCTRYDITSSRTKDDFVLPDGESMHCWPVAYYARHGIEDERARFGEALVRHDDGIGLERGAVVKVE